MDKIIIVSDIPQVIEGLRSFFKKKSIEIEIVGISYANLKMSSCPIEHLGNNFKNYFIFDKDSFTEVTESCIGISAKLNNSINFINFFECFSKSNFNNPDNYNNLGGILIYTYHPWEPEILHQDFEKIKNLLKNFPNSFVLETSQIFYRIPGHKIFDIKPNTCTLNKIGNKSDLIDYGEYIGSITDCLIKQKTSNRIPLKELHKNNLEFTDFFSKLNNYFFQNEFPVSTISFITKEEINTYLIDWPFKYYYIAQNKFIQEKIIIKESGTTLAHIQFIDKEKEKFLEDCNFIYFSYNVLENPFDLKINKIVRYFKSLGDSELKNLFGSDADNIVEENFNIEILHQWLFVLHTSVFFHTGLLNEDNWDNSKFKIETSGGSQAIEIYWFIHNLDSIEDEETNLHGLLSYTFRQISEQNLCPTNDEILKKGIKFYNNRRPIIESKAKETLLPYFTKELKKQARKSAISQVLARNMSHNHGSHVLSRMKHPDQIEGLRKMDEKIRTKVEEKINSSQNNFCDLENKFQYLGTHPHNFCPSIEEKEAYFNSYLESRMDFLADIATGSPAMESSKMFYGELIAGFDKNRILLDHISGVDNFKYKIQFHNYLNGVDKIDDLQVAIPNDILGQHAFYIILENIIRNTAKHSIPNKQNINSNVFTFHIEVRNTKKELNEQSEMLNNFYEIHLYDDVNFCEELVPFLQNEKEKFISEGISIPENSMMDRLEKLVHQQNIFINEPLLNNQNQLRQSAWGMIEMEAAASYLRKIPVEDIDDDKYKLIYDLNGENLNIIDNGYKTADILKTFIKNTCIVGRHLAYRIFLMKPKEILVVLDDSAIDKLGNSIDLKKFSDTLINYGIWITRLKNSKDFGLPEFKNNKVYEHEILLNLTNEEINIDGKNYKQGLLPDRIVKFDFITELSKIDNLEKAKQFKESVWSKFGEKFNDIYISPIKFGSVSGEFTEYDNKISYQIEATFDHHGEKWNENYNNLYRENNKYLEITSGLNNLLDILLKTAVSIKDYGTKRLGHSQDKTIFIKLLESIRSQVIVLDERIQEAAFTLTYKPENGKNIWFNELYLACGIYVPKKEGENGFNFSATSYPQKSDETIKNILSKVCKINISDDKMINFDRIEFLVIHLGVLEKILLADNKRNPSPIEEKEIIKGLIDSFIGAIPCHKEKSIKPIIISGRGMPPNLPDEIPYVSFSALSQYLIENRNKFLLTELLISTRNIHNNEK